MFKHVEGFLHGDAETLGHSLDDANVGLVGKDDVDVLGADPRLGECVLDGAGDGPNGPLEDLTTSYVL